MVNNKKTFSASTIGHLKTFKGQQHGMTLLEVLISMFVLAIGVLALLSTQLRSVAGVREAENESMVAQATQNLIEGMLINPTLSAANNADGEESGWANKSYTTYLKSGTQRATASTSTSPSSSYTKQQLAEAQLSQFSADLARIPNTTTYYTICQDQSGVKPTINGTNIDWHCDGNTSTTMVKVLWQTDLENNNEGNQNGLTVNGDNAVYTYQARVIE